MEVLWAQIISIVFNPYIHPIYLFIMVCIRNNLNLICSIPGIVFIALLPLLYHVLLHRMRKVDLDVSDRRKRPKILLVDALFYAIAFILYYLMLRLNSLTMISLIYLVVILSVTFVTLFDKICLHVVGFVIPSLVFYYINLRIVTLILLFLSIVVAYAKIKLKQHNLVQVIEGYLVPIIIVSLLFSVL